MKSKLILVTILVFGLVLWLSVNAYAAFTIAANQDVVARTVAAGGSEIIASFKVTDDGTALTLTSFTLDGAVGASDISGAPGDEANVTAVTIYEDINANGVLDVGVDVSRVSETDAADIKKILEGTAFTLPITAITFGAAEVRYFLAVATFATLGTDTGTSTPWGNRVWLDGKILTTSVETVPASVGLYTSASNTTVAIVATHYRFEAGLLPQTTGAAANGELIQAGTVLSAVDDYGNVDNGYDGEAQIKLLSYTTGADQTASRIATDAADAVGAAATNVFFGEANSFHCRCS